MTTPTPDPTYPSRQRQIRILYWIAAAVLAVTLVLEFVRPPADYLKVGSRVALLVAVVLLATARPAETRAKKTLIYGLVGLAALLLVLRLAR